MGGRGRGQALFQVSVILGCTDLIATVPPFALHACEAAPPPPPGRGCPRSPQPPRSRRRSPRRTAGRGGCTEPGPSSLGPVPTTLYGAIWFGPAQPRVGRRGVTPAQLTRTRGAYPADIKREPRRGLHGRCNEPLAAADTQTCRVGRHRAKTGQVSDYRRDRAGGRAGERADPHPGRS